MNITMVLAHPDPQSFNHAIAAAAVAALRELGSSVKLHDLYAEGFDPLLSSDEIPDGAKTPSDIDTHCREVAEADGLVFVHPNWWGQPPAILTGWIDRVLRPGIAYRFDETDAGDGVPVGLLRAGTAIVFNTSNTYPAREREVFGDPLERIWRDCVLGLCGVRDFHRAVYTPVITSSASKRAEWLTGVRTLVHNAFAPKSESQEETHTWNR